MGKAKTTKDTYYKIIGDLKNFCVPGIEHLFDRKRQAGVLSNIFLLSIVPFLPGVG